MKIKFLGPLDRVTGSCYWLVDEDIGVEFLVDCGMRQGDPNASEWNEMEWPFNPEELDFVLLTHAHIDHCGLIPALVRDGFGGKVYCTKETAELANVVLLDAIKHDGSYTAGDVDAIQWREPGRALFGHFNPVHQDVFVQFFPAGHIPGAVSIRLSWGPPPSNGRKTQRSILFSGDLGDNSQWKEHQPLMRHRWDPWKPADYVVTESTYGDFVRPAQETSAEARLGRLNAALREALFDRRGPVVIPAFAIQRTQDILADLTFLWCEEGSPFADVPVILDAPMAERVNPVMAKAFTRTHIARKDRDKVVPSWLAKGFFDRVGLDGSDRSDEQVAFGMLREMFGQGSPDREGREARVSSGSRIVNNWRQIWTPSPGASHLPEGPVVVVTGGGMADGGKVTDYLKEHLEDQRTTVLFTGHCSPGSVGGRLLDLARLSNDQRERLGEGLLLQGKEMPVAHIRASIQKLSGYSGHTDQDGLLSWLFPTHAVEGAYASGESVFITHGEARQRRSLAEAIRCRAEESLGDGALKDVLLPGEDDGWFDLNTGWWIIPPPEESGDAHQEAQPNLEEVRWLQARVQELERRLAEDGRAM